MVVAVPIRRIAPGVEAWQCPHADLPGEVEDGEIVLCDACSDALRSGDGRLVDADTGAPVLHRFEEQRG